jgi:hypothetical protein
MWDFIVLGQIPGTQIQVNFETWLAAIIGLLFCMAVLRSIKAIRSSHWLLARRINRIIQSAAYTQWLITRRHIQA